MRKLMLFALAAFVLTSCDNAAKKKNKSDSESEETARLKKPLKEEETSEEDSRTVTHQNADAKAGTKTESTSYASGWPSTEKNMFMSTCVDKAKAGMGETQAKNYCSCMLEKIEEMYPNATDATKLDQEKMTTLAKEC
ncbi:MAG TPA: hypothetical protein VFT06_01660, partial [Flavisolibacter sp.]|nr:hypothetical protein [Flavisolibacter sp.]